MYTLLKQEGAARRGRFETPHGTIETPVFMNVGTCAAIKGGISTMDLIDVKCQVELSNTYHLHLRPGDRLIHDMGGLRKFFNWDKPVLTDSTSTARASSWDPKNPCGSSRTSRPQ